MSIGYFPAMAKRLAKASKEAYRDEAVISAKDTQAIVRRDSSGVIIAFRGTEATNLKDWLTDIRIAKVKLHGVKVHKGFCRAYQDIRQKIFAELNDAPANTPIYITGHSLGAALATLCAFDLAMCGWRVDGLYTFGSPRVGGGSFKRAFNKKLSGRTFRVVNHNDIVCRIPTLLRWRHVGEVIYFDEAGIQRAAPPFWHSYRELWESIKSYKFGDRFTDHSIDEYLELI